MVDKLKSTYSPVIPFLVALSINTIALILSDNFVDGDAHTRSYMALQWLKKPFFISTPNEITWVFGPLHCYLNALSLLVWKNPTLSPRIVSLILTTLTIFPLFYSIRYVFGNREAYYTALLFCFYTLFIHPAAIATSEGINLLFVFLSIMFYLQYIERDKAVNLGFCAISLLLASMMRYESWLLPPFFLILIVTKQFFNNNIEKRRPVRISIVRLGLFSLVSHGFILLWLGSCWSQFGDPFFFLYYSGNLDAPTIAGKLEQSGAIRLVLYNLAFLPGVMLLSFPFLSFLAAVVGALHTWKRDRGNIFILLFALYLVFYLVVFVFSFQRFPLARFTTVPGALFFCFLGTGVVWTLSRFRSRLIPVAKIIFLVIVAANVVILAFFNQPSKQPINEKLRAISPLTKQPDCFYEAADYCNHLLETGSELILDCRNYNDRLLYLSLYRFHHRVHYSWNDTRNLGEFIRNNRPEYILYTKYPRRNHELFEFSEEGESAAIAGIPYTMDSRFGIFTIYKAMQIEKTVSPAN